MYQTIGIICAMDKEFALIRDALSHGQTEKVGLLTFYVAEQNGKKIVAAVSGIGKVNAACCAQMMISRFGAECILNSGVCGALSPTLHRMDIVLADELCYHDLEEEHLRDQLPGFSRFHPDTELNGLVRTLCKEQGLSCVTGRVASGDAFVLDGRRSDWAYLCAEPASVCGNPLCLGRPFRLRDGLQHLCRDRRAEMCKTCA